MFLIQDSGEGDSPKLGSSAILNLQTPRFFEEKSFPIKQKGRQRRFIASSLSFRIGRLKIIQPAELKKTKLSLFLARPKRAQDSTARVDQI